MLVITRCHRILIAMLVLLIEVALVVPTLSAQEKLSDLKPLVGKWAADGTGNVVSTEITVNEDGTYSRVTTLRAQGRNRAQNTNSATGTLELVDGTVHFKNSLGVTGTVELYVDAKGKRTTKWTSGSGSIELESRN